MKLLAIIVVLFLGFLLTTKGIPFAFVRVGRLLGFRMTLRPLARKRIERFKRIRRGYVAFVLLLTLFVSSFFLEVLVNHKPIYIRFGDTVAYPALRDLGNHLLPKWDPFVDFIKSSDFGLPGEQQLDYRKFDLCLADPDAEFSTLITAKQDQRRRVEADLADVRLEVAEIREDGDEPEEWMVDELKEADAILAKLDAEVAELQATQSIFAEGGASIVWPIYEHSASKSRLADLEGEAPFPPSLWRPDGRDRWDVPLGTDPAGIDILPIILYGFRTSVSFALMVLILGYSIGVLVGAMMGYYGGWVDILTQRGIEIWSSIPFLFTIMIISAILKPDFWVLVGLLTVLSAWLGITYLIRGEFYREKARDYVHAAVGTGVSDWKVIVKHILPNSLVPVIATAPFAFVGFINALVALDFLNFGLPVGTPSWGALLRVGKEFLTLHPHMTIIPVVALAGTLFMVTLIGEAVREAFDPKVFSRLR
ncbi:MAG: ABC transporter permease subunit [Planctomycetota bacterium]